MSCLHQWIVGCLIPGYDLCGECGTYRSKRIKPPESIYTANYWSHDRGHSTMAEQSHNILVHAENGVTKSEFALQRLRVKGSALEIGCAPGVFLRELDLAGFSPLTGVEFLGDWDDEIRANTKADMLYGEFPEVTQDLPQVSFNLIVGMDVFEHCPGPKVFLRECFRLLKPGGQLMLMLPLIEPGTPMPERMFNVDEHIWIHSKSNIESLMAEHGFSELEFSRWCPGHECISVVRV